MFSKVCVLLLAIGLSQAVPQMYMPDAGFMQFMMKSRALGQDNPTRSLECFDIYLPQLTEVSEQYKTDFAKCLTLAEEARDQIDDTTQDDRAKIDGSATQACSALTACSKLVDSVSYFTCYTDAGAQNTKTMYTISADSSELLAVVVEEYRLIENNKFVCTNKSDRAYVENTAKVYNDLEACLSGKEVTTASPITSEPTTVSTEGDSSSASTEGDSSSASTEGDSSSASTEGDSSSASTEGDSSSASTEGDSSSASTEGDSSSVSTEESTSASDSTTAADKENFPEEDLSRIAQEQKKMKSFMEDFKNWLKRH